MSEEITALAHRVRLPIIGRYLGQLGLVLAVLLLVPLLVAVLFADTAYALRSAELIAALVIVSLFLRRFPSTDRIQINEALAVTALTFVMAALCIAYILAAEKDLSPIDALFEGVSAVTTTGLTTLPSVEARPASFLLIRAWGQWFGGLGIVVLSVALLFGHHTAARRLAHPTSGPENLETTARTHARRMLFVYLLLTALGLLGALTLIDDPVSAVAHVLAAISTGGFSTFDASLAGLPDWPARFWLTGIAILGALPLPLYYRFYRQGVHADAELMALLAGMFITVVLLALLAPQLRLDQTVLLGVSAQTTTGFSASTIATLPDAAKWVLVIAMAAGGTVGSTAGGIKMLRLLLLLRLLQLAIRRSAVPAHAVLTPRLGRHSVDAEDFEGAALILFLFVITILVSALIFIAAGYPPMNGIFEVVSAVGTVGLSTGISRPGLSAGLKLLLCADMLLGRLEMVALLILFYPRTWFGKTPE